MRILHFSDEGLPDSRLDRYSFIEKKLLKIKEVHFLGKELKYQSDSYNSFFDSINCIKISSKAQLGLPFFYNKLKREFLRFYKDLNPDVVHCHNIITGKVCFDLKIPYIYDDHEYWKYQIKARSLVKTSAISLKKITNKWYQAKISNWEPKVIKTARYVITVSDPIQEEHKLVNRKTEVIPNFLTSYEIEKLSELTQPKDQLKILLISYYSSHPEQVSVNRYLENLSKIDVNVTIIGNIPQKYDNFNYLGHLPYSELINQLPNYHLGLYTIQRDKLSIGYYKYVSSNRVFQYAHAGVLPVIHNSSTFMKKVLKSHYIAIDDESKVKDIVEKYNKDFKFMEKNPGVLRNYAQSNLILDKYSNKIQDIYETSIG